MPITDNRADNTQLTTPAQSRQENNRQHQTGLQVFHEFYPFSVLKIPWGSLKWTTITNELKKALIMLLYFYSRCVLIISLSLASLKVRNAVIRRYDKFGRISSSGSRQVVVMWDDNVGPSLSRVSPDSIILTEPPSLSSSRVHAKASL